MVSGSLQAAKRRRAAPLWLVAFAALAASSPEQAVAQTSVRAESLPPNLALRKQGVDWPRFLGPTNDNKSSETGLTLPWPMEGPRLVWQAKLGQGYAAPVISRGRLFHFDRLGDEATLHCLSAETGEELWTYSYPTRYEDAFGYNNGPRCCPVVDDDRVYVHGPEGELHCVRAVDGSRLWSKATHKEFHFANNFFGVGSTPLIYNDLLLVQIGGSPEGTNPYDVVGAQPNNALVVAFDKRTGEERYRVGDDLASYSSPVVAPINGRDHGLALGRSGLLVFDPASGKEDFFFPWRARSVESVNASNPVVVGAEVLISETYGPGSAMLSVGSDGPTVIWQDGDRSRSKRLQTHWNTAIHHDGFIYGSSGRHTNNAELRCVDWKTGEVKWSEPGLTRGSLLYVDGHFIHLGEYGDLIVFRANPEEFDEVQRFEPKAAARGPSAPGFGPSNLLEYPCWAAPVLSHGLLYVHGDRRLLCYEVIPEAAPAKGAP